MKTFKNKEYLNFVIARVIALLTKPFFLWFLLAISYQYLAEIISIYYLVISSVMVIFNNEAHFEYYKLLFNEEESTQLNLNLERKKYYERIIYHYIIFSTIVFIITFFMVKDLKLTILFFSLVVLEKIFDEIQRLLQFRKLFNSWSVIFMLKSLIPLIVCFIVYMIFSNEMVLLIGYFLSAILVNILIIMYFANVQQRMVIFEILKNIKYQNFIKYIKTYKEKLFLNQLQSFSTRNVPLLDRLLIRFFLPGFLPQLSIISQVGSISIMIVDYFLIAHRRKEYLILKKSVFDIITKKKLVVFFILSFLTYVSILLAAKLFGFLNEINIEIMSLLVIGLYYAIFAIGQHFVQFNFWKIKRKYTLSVDISYYLVGTIMFLLLRKEFGVFPSIIFSLFVGHIMRLILSILISTKSSNYGFNNKS